MDEFRRLRFNRVPMTMKEAIAAFGGEGVTHNLVHKRMYDRGWSFEEAVTTPRQPSGAPRRWPPGTPRAAQRAALRALRAGATGVYSARPAAPAGDPSLQHPGRND